MIKTILTFCYFYLVWMAVFSVFITINILIEGNREEIIYNLKCDIVLAIVLFTLYKVTK